MVKNWKQSKNSTIEYWFNKLEYICEVDMVHLLKVLLYISVCSHGRLLCYIK